MVCLSSCDSESAPLLKGAKTRYFYRNILCLSMAYICIHTVYLALQNLHSTANASKGVGVISLASLYVSLFLSGLFAPFIVKYTGYKWAVFIGFIGHSIYTVTNIYPTMYTLIPSSLMLGATSSVAWTGQGPYVTNLAKVYAATKAKEMEAVTSQFNGIFYFFFQTSQIWGNLVSSLILTNTDDMNHNSTEHCGFRFCKDNNKELDGTASSIPGHVMYLLIGVFLMFDVIGLLITPCFVSNITPSDDEISFSRNSTLDTLKLHKNKHLLLLLLFFTYNGFEQAFIFGEYTQVRYKVILISHPASSRWLL